MFFVLLLLWYSMWRHYVCSDHWHNYFLQPWLAKGGKTASHGRPLRFIFRQKRLRLCHLLCLGCLERCDTNRVCCVMEPLMRNVMQLKGNKLAAVLSHSWNLSTFVFGSKKKIIMYVIWFLMRIPKWGLLFLYLL